MVPGKTLPVKYFGRIITIVATNSGCVILIAVKDAITGSRPQNVVLNRNLGNGVANYALCYGTWYSVNLFEGKVQDVRWRCSPAESAALTKIVEEEYI